MTTTRREFIKTVGAAIATSQIPPEPPVTPEPTGKSARHRRRRRPRSPAPSEK